jgi:NAD(P)-dependent dehydrogenase (short-subunit alcohol dehydrogenase family)
MNIDLTGKSAIVTGSTRGIGFAIAKGLAQSGADVVVNGRAQASVEKAVAALKKAGLKGRITGVAADLASAAGCDTLVKTVPSTDILVNNVGIFGPQDFFGIPDSEWTRFFETNVMSGVRLSRAYLPAMIERNWGRVIFISSESGLNIPEDMIHYGFTKTAQLSISRGLAKLAAGTGVTVNAVLPGPTLSEGVIDMLKDAEGGGSAEQKAKTFIKEHRPSSIIQRAATVEEVANMVVYAASPQASATTGAALRVDGGVVDTIASGKPVSLPLIFRKTIFRLIDDDRRELGQRLFDPRINPRRDVFRGRIFEPLDLIQTMMIEPCAQRLDGFLDVEKIDDETGCRIDRAFELQFNAIGVAVHGAATMRRADVRQEMRGFEGKGLSDSHVGS